MNCKQDDLAYFISSDVAAGNVVKCIKRYDGPWKAVDFSPGWQIDRPVLRSDGKRWSYVQDKNLRPIRPQPHDATDETLTWLDVPTKQGETA